MNKKLMYKLSICLVFILFLASCEYNMLEDSSSNNDDDDDNTCRLTNNSYKNYSIEINGRWNATNFDGFTPAKYIAGGHFSRFVVFTHKSNVNIFEEGSVASSGLEKLAEEGSIDIVSMHNSNTDIGCAVVGVGMQGGDSQTIVVPVNNTYNTITILSMIAPTSDWFVAKRIQLGNDNSLSDVASPFVLDASFKTNGSENMKNYDAGTEQDILAFDLNNLDENPKQAIFQLSTPFDISDVLVEIEYTQTQ